MPASVVRGIQPHRENLIGEPEGDDAAAHRQDVRVVVLPGQACRIQIVTQRGADAADFICRDLLALAASAEHDAAIGFAGDDCAPDRRADWRVVHRLFAVRAVVVHLVAESGEDLFQMFFEVKPGMVGANRDAH